MALQHDTPVLMFSGKVTTIEQVTVGDLLMGPDSTPRKVLTKEIVSAESFLIKPIRGQAFYGDREQALLLKKSVYLTRTPAPNKVRKPKYRHLPNVITVSVQNMYETNSCALYKNYFLFKNAVQYPPQPTPIDPYFLGIWLGDGARHNISVTTADKEIRDEVFLQAAKYGLKVREDTKENNQATNYTIVRGNIKGYGIHRNPLINTFKSIGLIRNKHIPDVYLFNCENVRAQLLAGIIDTDGYCSQYSYYEIIQKSYSLAAQVCALANSLGFRSFIKTYQKSIKSLGFTGTYHCVVISGDLTKIPVRLPRKKIFALCDRYDRRCTGFRIHSTGAKQRMIMVTTDKDNQFLLQDGTVLCGYIAHVPALHSYWQAVRDRKWTATLSDIQQFVISRQRMPSSSSPDKEEARMANWLGNHFRARYHLSELRRTKYEAFIALLRERNLTNTIHSLRAN